jgi:hypothetical protein
MMDIWLQNEDDEDNDDENWLSVVHLSRMVKDFTTPRDNSIIWLLLLWMCESYSTHCWWWMLYVIVVVVAVVSSIMVPSSSSTSSSL